MSFISFSRKAKCKAAAARKIRKKRKLTVKLIIAARKKSEILTMIIELCYF